MPIQDLSAQLWRERELLGLLEFKLEEERLLLVSAHSRWVGNATREVEAVLERVKSASLARSAISASVAEELGLPGDAPLADIVDAMPLGVLRDVMAHHLIALRTATSSIVELRDANEQYLRAAQRSTQETMAHLSDGQPLYGPGSGKVAAGPHIIDTDL